MRFDDSTTLPLRRSERINWKARSENLIAAAGGPGHRTEPDREPPRDPLPRTAPACRRHTAASIRADACNCHPAGDFEYTRRLSASIAT